MFRRGRKPPLPRLGQKAGAESASQGAKMTVPDARNALPALLIERLLKRSCLARDLPGFSKQACQGLGFHGLDQVMIEPDRGRPLPVFLVAITRDGDQQRV